MLYPSKIWSQASDKINRPRLFRELDSSNNHEYYQLSMQSSPTEIYIAMFLYQISLLFVQAA